MTIRLDPALPLVWRTPNSLQVGVDSPVVVLTEVTVAEERMLAALTRGISREGLRLVGRSSGLTDSQITQFEQLVSPAIHLARASEPAEVVISGTGRTVEQLGWRLAETGLVAQSPGQPADEPAPAPAFAVVVAHFVVAPQHFGEWLRNDIPHLPIVYSDTGVRIGPIVEPGLSPCLYCIERHHTDVDPAWPAIATQLLGRRSMAETAFVASEVAVLATRIIRARIDGAPAAEARSVTLDVQTGALSDTVWVHHPACACQDLATQLDGGERQPTSEQGGALGRAPRESETQRSHRRAARRTATTKGAVAFAPW